MRGVTKKAIKTRNCVASEKENLPEIAKPENPTARVSAVIASTRLDVLPTTSRKTASIPKPTMTG